MIRMAVENGTHNFEWISTNALGKNIRVDVILTSIIDIMKICISPYTSGSGRLRKFRQRYS